ncbi:uncharacterized protein LOC130495651 [Raphanus sativus]|uniref:Uncharacterized protein LOC130495651 n=1 Tax=Raphanus sativus TaxID=3726 RepID=A0A9W3BV50_RAPSA|nr:uncharacterized protein LOC130495651 [Raphanus sativus]
MFHALQTKPGGRAKRMAIQTDMNKAYNRMEWFFIEDVMRKMGFSEVWIEWIMRCVTSVKYQVLINGEPRGHIVPERDLRQGDPLSLFIFILCTEALVSLLSQAENQGKIMGMRASGKCINFEKYSLLFGKRILANERQQIKDTLGIQNEEEMGSYLGIPEDISGSKGEAVTQSEWMNWQMVIKRRKGSTD